jgi:hypothetical protein
LPVLTKNSLRQSTNYRGSACVRLLGAFGVGAQQHRGIMAASRGDDVHWHASIKQQRFMRAPQVVKA